MEYEFHTQLPIERRPSHEIEYIWVQAIMAWDPSRSAPRIVELHCDDPDIMTFWESSGSTALEAAIISDALKLHGTEYFGDKPQGWKPI